MAAELATGGLSAQLPAEVFASYASLLDAAREARQEADRLQDRRVHSQLRKSAVECLE